MSSITSSISLSSLERAAIATAALAVAKSEDLAAALSNSRTFPASDRTLCPIGQDGLFPSLGVDDLIEFEGFEC